MSEYVDNVGLNQALTSVYNYINKYTYLSDEISAPIISKINNQYLDETGFTYMSYIVKNFIDGAIPVIINLDVDTEFYKTGTYSMNLEIIGIASGTITVLMSQYAANESHLDANGFYKFDFISVNDDTNIITGNKTVNGIYQTTLTISTTRSTTYTIKYKITKFSGTPDYSSDEGQTIIVQFTPYGSSTYTESTSSYIHLQIS